MKESVIIQNKTSMNNTLDDRGEEAGLSRSVSGSRLGSLAAVSFAVIQPERGESLVQGGDPRRSLGFIPQLTI